MLLERDHCAASLYTGSGSLLWARLRRCSVLFLFSASSLLPISLSRFLFRSRLPSALPFRLLRFFWSLLREPLSFFPHFFLLGKHSLFSEVAGQGLPWGLGFCTILRVRVSSLRQVFNIREQRPHSLHSPTSQGTEGTHSISCSLGSNSSGHTL